MLRLGNEDRSGRGGRAYGVLAQTEGSAAREIDFGAGAWGDV